MGLSYGRWVFLTMFTTALTSFAAPLTQMQIQECQSLLDRQGLTISKAIDGVRTLENGVVSFKVHSGYRPRQISLPSIVHYLRSRPEEKVLVVTPGNTLYEGTRHNLGFHFADHLIASGEFVGVTEEAATSQQFPRKEAIEITYDDSTARNGELVFHSEPGYFRTASGEIYFKEEGGKVVVLVRAIGDYNETGDFVIPVMEAIGAQPRNIIVVQDNLTVDKLTIASEAVGPINANGNNAIFSLNRSLAQSLLPRLIEHIRSHEPLGQHVPDAAWAAFTEQFTAMANDLDASNAFRNAESIAGPVRSLLAKVIKKKILKEEREKLLAPNKELRKQRGMLLREIKGNKELVEADRIRLEAELEAFDAKHAATIAAEKSAVQALESSYETLSAAVEQLIVTELSYARISMGTGRPEDGNNVDFVLGKFDPAEYNRAFFEEVRQALTSQINPQ